MARQTNAISFKTQKRSDVVVGEIKHWISDEQLGPGDRLPKEADLQATFGVSKGTMREALKSLEVQGLVSVSTGPRGGATVVEVEFERTFEFVQNYLFFKEVTVAELYRLRKLLEPELAASAIAHLTAADLDALEASVEACAPIPETIEKSRQRRREDLHFHDIIADASPNKVLALFCKLINQVLQTMVVFDADPLDAEYARLGETNAHAHHEILHALRAGNEKKVRRLMLQHIEQAEEIVLSLDAVLRSRLSDALPPSIRPSLRNPVSREKK